MSGTITLAAAHLLSHYSVSLEKCAMPRTISAQLLDQGKPDCDLRRPRT